MYRRERDTWRVVRQSPFQSLTIAARRGHHPEPLMRCGSISEPDRAASRGKPSADPAPASSGSVPGMPCGSPGGGRWDPTLCPARPSRSSARGRPSRRQCRPAREGGGDEGDEHRRVGATVSGCLRRPHLRPHPCSPARDRPRAALHPTVANAPMLVDQITESSTGSHKDSRTRSEVGKRRSLPDGSRQVRCFPWSGSVWRCTWDGPKFSREEPTIFHGAPLILAYRHR
jgi:hypothetical protein